MDRELRLSMQGRSVAQNIKNTLGHPPQTVKDLSVSRQDVLENPRRVLKRLEQYGVVVVEGGLLGGSGLLGNEAENDIIEGENDKTNDKANEASSLCHRLDRLLLEKARKLRESGEVQASNYGGPEDSCGDIHGGDCRPGMDSCRIDMKLDLDEGAAVKNNSDSVNTNSEISLIRKALRRALGDAGGGDGDGDGIGLARVLLGFFGNAAVLMAPPLATRKSDSQSDSQSDSDSANKNKLNKNKFLVSIAESQSLTGLCELAALVVSPGAPGQVVHSDSSWYHGKSAVTCFAAIHDVENAPTRVFPFTHCIPEAHSPEGRRMVAENERREKEKRRNAATDIADSLEVSTEASTEASTVETSGGEGESECEKLNSADKESYSESDDSFLSDIHGVSLFLKRGDIALMDSRLLHYGAGWDESASAPARNTGTDTEPNRETSAEANTEANTETNIEPNSEPHRTLFYFTVCEGLENLPVGSTITILQKYLKEQPLLLTDLEEW